MPDAPVRQAQDGVVLFNVKYSPNLGDGVIAACLEHGLAARLPGTRITSIDLAGRREWLPPGDGRGRVRLLRLLQRMPGPLRDGAVCLALGLKLRRSLVPAWRRATREAGFAVFGGGQLVQDGDLNFPLKLAAAIGLCHARRIPVAVYGVGASPSRSTLGGHLLRRLLASPRLVHLSARDAASRASLEGYRPSLPIDLARDPGLLAAELWPAPPKPPRARALVGLGITHPAPLHHHGGHAAPQTDDALARRYGHLVEGLLARGLDVMLFTNGAAEDEDFLSAHAERLRAADPAGARVLRAPRAADPAALARQIAQLDGLVAHRLHAIILAYAYRVPAIGLRWDGKLDAFLASVDGAERAADLDEAGASAIPARLAAVIEAGTDPARHAEVVAEAAGAIDRLAEVIAAARALRRTPAGRPAPGPRDPVLGLPAGP
ncbi:polysaccharide pyruvyl transferase family protein [Methylobacterium durans]|uniref:polysaccharide pyruvyl transferase family protein n=1 Tax=Methylobacterium durans TaxID=2202825 RepID=UPI002AFFAB8D|nr:polysaccharide pyruvyl transferase family protein [Methylobacterium durans]MEA1832111.1 polysaccharide pyruvyl transferase family protein [Methylobacterium durans]